jgi:uncharacterized protein (PEP-CTERM system associated)
VENRRSEQLVDSFFLIADSEGNPVLDPISGDPVVVNVPDVQQIDEDYVTERLRGAILVSGIRTSFSLTGSVSRRDYEVTRINEDAHDLGLNFNRQLGGGFSAQLGARYQFLKNTGSGDSDYYDVRFSLSKAIGRSSSAAFNVSHHERDADDEDFSYTENRVGLSLFTSFL